MMSVKIRLECKELDAVGSDEMFFIVDVQPDTNFVRSALSHPTSGKAPEN